ncbi:MAG: Hsp33 family molecular chaperone HslO [Candidatus Methylacidiphilales bacterium]
MPEFRETTREGITVESYYVRDRHVLLTRADFSALYVDFYLHLADLKMREPEAHLVLFKDVLAALVLHGASRPWNEIYAWTLSFQKPRVNLFVTGNNPEGTVVGTLFSVDVRESDRNMMYAEVVRGSETKRRSVVDFSHAEVFPAVEHFYRQSEQRLCRLFRSDEDEFWFFSAQPDCDEGWLLGLEVEDLAVLEQNEVLSLLEKRQVRWHCGCHESRMFSVLLPPFLQDAEALFQDEASLKMHCPRCGMPYVITREAMEAFARENAEKS